MTVKEIADELKVSKTTIKNIIKKLHIVPQQQNINGQNRIILSDSECEQIKEYYKNKNLTANTANFQTANTANFQTANTEKFAESTENTANFQTSNTAKQSNNTANNVSLELLRILQEEIEKKDKIIDSLNERLSEAMKVIDQQQQLNAISEKRVLELEDKIKEEPPVKKGFFSRFKK